MSAIFPNRPSSKVGYNWANKSFSGFYLTHRFLYEYQVPIRPTPNDMMESHVRRNFKFHFKASEGISRR